MIKKLNKEQFNEVISQDKPSLICFGSISCGKCMMAKAKFPSYEEAVGDLANIYLVEAEDCKDLFDKYGVEHMPVFILFKNGKNIGTRSAIGLPENIVDFVKVNTKEK